MMEAGKNPTLNHPSASYKVIQDLENHAGSDTCFNWARDIASSCYQVSAGVFTNAKMLLQKTSKDEYIIENYDVTQDQSHVVCCRKTILYNYIYDYRCYDEPEEDFKQRNL